MGQGKFALEFEKQPSLLFVQFDAENDFQLYQDGELVNGLRSIRINAGFDDFTTHEIEYVSGATKAMKKASHYD